MFFNMVRLAAAAAVITVLPAAAQAYQGWSCRDLWMERNQIFRSAGYCFRTPRAISTFGNAGCQYDRQADLPLSPSQRRAVEEISRAERAAGCTD